MAESPLLVVVMSMLPRLLVPLAAPIICSRAVARCAASGAMALPAARWSGTLTNTVFYLGLMLLFYVFTCAGRGGRCSASSPARARSAAARRPSSRPSSPRP